MQEFNNRFNKVFGFDLTLVKECWVNEFLDVGTKNGSIPVTMIYWSWCWTVVITLLQVIFGGATTAFIAVGEYMLNNAAEVLKPSLEVGVEATDAQIQDIHT